MTSAHPPDLDAVARAILDTYLPLYDAGGRRRRRPPLGVAGALRRRRYRDLYLEVYPGERGLRAKVTEHWVLDPAASPDQRVPVTP
jgi:hypothetical protein